MSAQTELILQTVVKGADKAADSLDEVSSSVSEVGKAAEKTTKTTQTFSQKLSANKEGFLALGAAAAAASYAITGAIKSAVREAVNFENALVGLKSIAEGTGRDFNQAKKFIQDFTSDGLVTAGEAANALKNLFQRGFSMEQSITILERFKDAASFGRQSALGLGEAIQGAAEGLKNENSMLVDNAGVTKNVAKMWDEYAKSIGAKTNALTLAQKREAEYQGILKETQFQVGDAIKYADGYAGAQARQQAAALQLQQTLGTALLPTMTQLTQAMTAILVPIAKWVEEHPKLAANILTTAAAITTLATAIMGLGIILGPIKIGLAAIGAVIGSISAPVLAVIGVLTLLGVAFIDVYKNWAYVKPQLIRDWEAFKEAIKEIVMAIATFVENMGNKIIETVDKIIEYLSRKADAAKNFARSILQSYQDSSIGQVLGAPGKALGDWMYPTSGGGFIGARALGGPVQAGKPYLVGENGPEIVTPGQTGYVTPNNKIGNNQSIIINISGVFGRDAVDEIGDSIVKRLKGASYI